MIREALSRFYRRYVLLRLCRLAAQGAGLAALLAFALVLADRVTAFPPRVRVILDLVFLASIAAFALARVIAVSLISLDHVALCVDARLRSGRHAVLTAWQLESAADAPSRTPAEAAFAAEHIRQAAEAVEQLPLSEVFPPAQFAREFRFMGVVPLCLIAALVFGGASILPRYLDPYGDHPPYSALRFRVGPKTPRVVYGEDIEVSAIVEGGDVDELVLYTEDETGTQQSPCFRAQTASGDGGRKFTQRIEKVTRPLKFWFAAGRARSKWHRLELILIPKVVSLRATVTPPDYTLGTPESFVVGQRPIRGLQGSKIVLTAFSNRPLSSGMLTIRPFEGQGEPVEVEGTRHSLRSVSFHWRLTQSAALKLNVTDVEGRTTREEVAFFQEAVPDKPPEIYFERPQPTVLATPDSTVPYRIMVRDDWGLKSISLFRGLRAFRETVRRLPLKEPYATESPHDGTFDLAALGVRPGDEIEYFCEASDHNPWRVGLAMSKVFRIRVISEEQYLDIQRRRAQLKDFEARHAAIQDALKRLLDEAENLKKAMESGDEKRVAREQSRFAKQLERTGRILDKYIEARALYDIEKAFQSQLKPVRSQVRALWEQVKNQKLTRKDLDDFIRSMKSDAMPAADKMKRQVDMLAKAARVRQMESEFVRIVKEQGLLHRRLGPLSHLREVAQELSRYAGEQERIRQDLDRFAKTLADAVKELPADLAPLGESATAFLEALEKLAAQGDMKICEGACKAGRGKNAYAAAEVAYKKLRSLLSEKTPKLGDGAGMCQAFAPAVMKQSLDQLMQGYIGSFGAGLAGASGYGMPAQTLANVQLAGPPVLGGATDRSGRGPGLAGGAAVPTHVESAKARPSERRKLHFRFDPHEPFPEKYRDQLIEYFKGITREADR